MPSISAEFAMAPGIPAAGLQATDPDTSTRTGLHRAFLVHLLTAYRLSPD